jgi:hypothetical protein
LDVPGEGARPHFQFWISLAVTGIARLMNFLAHVRFFDLDQSQRLVSGS